MKDRIHVLNQTELFVLDMDGTFYLGDQILDGALAFLEMVEKTNRKYIFFTNNSSKSPKVYMDKLAGMNCHITRSQIMTSGDVTMEYLKRHYPGKRVYLVGTPELRDSFQEMGIALTESTPDIVVVGFDTMLTYEKLERACTYIRDGALFLATHLDINCPTDFGYIPDCGSFCAAIALSTGIKPKYLGKPYAETAELVLEKTGVPKEKITFVGDRLYTDVAAGVNNGAAGVLVLTGEAKEEDVETSGVKPDAVFASLKEMALYLK